MTQIIPESFKWKIKTTSTLIDGAVFRAYIAESEEDCSIDYLGLISSNNEKIKGKVFLIDGVRFIPLDVLHPKYISGTTKQTFRYGLFQNDRRIEGIGLKGISDEVTIEIVDPTEDEVQNPSLIYDIDPTMPENTPILIKILDSIGKFYKCIYTTASDWKNDLDDGHDYMYLGELENSEEEKVNMVNVNYEEENFSVFACVEKRTKIVKTKSYMEFKICYWIKLK